MRGAAVLRGVARAALVLGGALAVLALLGIACANLRWTRAWLAREVSTLVSGQIVGTLSIQELGHVGFGSVAGVRAELADSAGHRVLAVSGLMVELDWWRAARSWLGGGALELAVPRLTVEALSADLHVNEAGELALISALDTPASEAGSAEASAPLELELRSIRVRQIHAQNAPAPLTGAEFELRELAARVWLSGEGLHFELGQLRTEARGLPVIAGLSGELEGVGMLPLGASAAAALEVNAAWRGQLGELPVEAAVVLGGRHLSGAVRVRASAAAVQRLWTEGSGAAPAPSEAVAARIAFEGPLDDLALRALIEWGRSELTVDGRVDLEQLSGRATVSGAAVELSSWLPAAPPSSLGFLAKLQFEQQRGSLTGQLELHSGGGYIATLPLPYLALSMRLTPLSIEARLNAKLPGASAELELAMPRDAASVPVELRAQVTDLARALAALQLPAAGLSGRGTARASGTLLLGGEPALASSSLRAELRDLRAGSLGASQATVLASALGPLTAPRLTVQVDSRGVSLPSYPLARLRLQAEGNVEQLRLRARLDPVAARPVWLTARLSPADARLARLRLRAGSGPDAVQASARALRSTPAGVAIEGLVVRTGDGRLELDGRLHGATLNIRARSASFSAAALARGLGLDLALPEGNADLSLQLDYRGGRASGALSGSVTQLAIGPLQDGRLRLDLVAQEGVLRGLAGLSAPQLGELLLQAEAIELPRRWEPAALGAFEGELELLAMADLTQLQRAAGNTLSGAALGGSLQGRLSLRGDGRSPPHARLVLATRGLGFAPPASGRGELPPGGAGRAVHRWQDVDVELRLELDDARLRAQAALIDGERRVLAHLRGSSPLPLARLLRGATGLDPRALPVDVQVQVPERELGEFPAPLRFSGVKGTAQAALSAHGTLGNPALAAHVELSGLRLEHDRRALPLQLVADAWLQQDQLRGSAAVRDVRSKLVSVQASATVTGGARPNVRDLALELRSNGLPLDAMGPLLGQELAGELYGSLELRTSGGKPTAEGSLWVNAPSYRGFRQKRARWEVRAGPDAFSTELRLEQRDGQARLALGGPWQWHSAVLPSLSTQRLHAELHAEDFDLRALGPLLPEQARGVAGRLDAHLVLDPEHAQAASGTARLRDGRIYVGVLGQEFRDVEVDVRLDGSGELAIQRLSARALNGRLSARGAAQLDGLALRDAALELTIPRADPLPVMLEGVTVATVWGSADLSAVAEPTAAGSSLLAVQVRLPRLQVILPRLRPHGVQDLADEPTIEPGTFLRDGRFVTLPLPPYEASPPDPESPALVVHVQVELGDEVWVEQEPMLELKVVGAVQLELREELTVRGQLRLARGTIEVQGRTFQIERGEITFLPSSEPSNPTVVATGVYTAPEGTRVYADFVGPVETGKLSLRSEPPLRDDQILSLLLFGTSDGSFGAATEAGPTSPLGTVGGTALVAGGNALARGLSVELRRLTSLDIQTRIGERGGEPQPEVAVQLTPRLTAELAYRIQAPTPGRAPDRTYLTLDLRLLRHWFLSTTLGDAGSFVLELLWRYRY